MDKERKKITLTMRLYKYRLEVMLNNCVGDLDVHCPAKLGFHLLSGTPLAKQTWKNDPCIVCREFMKITIDACPCWYYGCGKAARFALKKLNKKGAVICNTGQEQL